MSGQMRCLLDKVTARRILEGLVKISARIEVLPEELFALDLFQQGRKSNIQLYIVPSTLSVMQRFPQTSPHIPLLQLFLQATKTVYPARYFTRWSRRLRDYGFTREDAAVLSLATFGTVENGSILGVHYLATYDQAMINNWYHQQEKIQTRLATMCRDLTEPYCYAVLSQVVRPEQVR
ncbi:MAG: hypothetical protein KJ069_06310 [Anaerolineae bacterium]|nr:hypothetical protein [Anaerolineae bacterium]